MPQDLLAEIDASAEALAETRSGVIREATVEYLQRRKAEDAAAKRRRAAGEALEIMKDLASLPCRDDRPSLEILRELREFDGLGKPARASAGDGEQ
jgi:predicted transcriptional regulator